MIKEMPGSVASGTLCITAVSLIIKSARDSKFNIHGSVHRKYILIYIQQDAKLHSLFISGNCSTCFGWRYHPKHVKQFPEINKRCNVASCWIYRVIQEESALLWEMIV